MFVYQRLLIVACFAFLSACSGRGLAQAVPSTAEQPSIALEPLRAGLAPQSTAQTVATPTGPSVAQIAIASVGTGTQISLAFPTVPRAGDVLVAGIGVEDGSQSTTTAPAGWSRVAASSSGVTGVTVTTFSHLVAASENGTYGFTVSSPRGAIGLVAKGFDLVGVAPTGSIASSSVNAGSGGLSDSAPSVQATSANLLPLAFLVQGRSTAAPVGYSSSPVGWSEPYQVLFGDRYALAFAAHAGPLTSAGATVSYTQSWQSVSVFGKAAQLLFLKAGAAPVAPSPAPTAVPVTPAVGVTTHVPNLAYYQGMFLNTRIDAQWFAQHYTMTQQGSDDSYAKAFLAAGGKYAMTYTDPTMTANCTWPATYICKTPLGASSGLPHEGSWLHDSKGRRLHVTAYGSQSNGSWQERLNPADPEVRAAFAAETRAWGGNAIFSDDTSASIDPTPPGYLDYDMYKYGALPYEYCKGTQAQCEAPSAKFQSDFGGLLSSSPHPVFTNGGSLADNLAVMQRTPNIIGNGLEGCYQPAFSDVKWLANQNFILQATAIHKYSLCYAKYGSNMTAERAYYLASYFMVYDGTYAVMWENMPMSHGDTGIMPEYAVVPGGATVNPTTMASVQKAKGVYVREFTKCAQNGVVFGKCAAVVNNNSTSVTVPSMSGLYTQTMSFAGTTSWYDGGAVTWSTGRPSTIGANSGVILR